MLRTQMQNQDKNNHSELKHSTMEQERNDNFGTTINGCIKEECDISGSLSGKDSQPLNGNLVNVKLEDTMMYGSDTWLKNNVEMEEGKELKPKIKQEPSSDTESETNNVQSESESDTDGDDNEELERIDEGQSIEIQKLKKCMKGGKKMKHDVGNLLEGSKNSLGGCIKGQDTPRNIKTMRTVSPQHKSKLVTNESLSGATTTNFSTFKCSMCPLIYKSWGKFHKHMKSKHNHSVKMGEYQKFVQEAFSHTCRVCLKKILCCSEFLAKHFRCSHNMSLNKYKNQFNYHNSGTKECEKLLQNGSQSNLQIGSMCTFKCPECKKCYKSIQSFYCHSSLTKKQSCSFTSMSSRNSWYIYVDKVVTHKCQICSTLLLCDRNVLWRHALHVHGIKTLEDYCKHTGCILKKTEKEKIQSLFQEVPKGDRIEEKVGNFCRFTCHKCGHVSNCWRSMREHLNKNGHNLSKSKKWYDNISKTILHKCLICGKLILNDTQFLLDHMRYAHKLNVPIYIEKFKLYST